MRTPPAQPLPRSRRRPIRSRTTPWWRKPSAGPPAPIRRSTNRLPSGARQIESRAIPQHPLQPGRRHLARRSAAFRLELLRAGYNLQTAVTVSTVENGLAQDVAATPAMFQMESTLPAQLGKVSLPLSGFRLRTRNQFRQDLGRVPGIPGRQLLPRGRQESAVRAVGARTGHQHGRSVRRGIPRIHALWIEKPAPRANAVVIYALLESESTTGAYRFTVQPGVETLTDVDLTLFPRAEMRVTGIAPLTLDVPVRRDQSRPPGRLPAGSARFPTDCRSHRRPANTYSGRWRIRSSSRSPPSRRSSRRASDWCKDPGSKSIFKISTRSMSGAQRMDRAQGRLGRRLRRTGGNSIGPREQ